LLLPDAVHPEDSLSKFQQIGILGGPLVETLVGVSPVSVAAIVLFAVSASGALFPILELSQPFSRVMQISSAPLNNALAPL
jgi:hypothetical protein